MHRDLHTQTLIHKCTHTETEVHIQPHIYNTYPKMHNDTGSHTGTHKHDTGTDMTTHTLICCHIETHLVTTCTITDGDKER